MKAPSALRDQGPERLFLNFGILDEVDRVTLLRFACGGYPHVDGCFHKHPTFACVEEGGNNKGTSKGPK